MNVEAFLVVPITQQAFGISQYYYWHHLFVLSTQSLGLYIGSPWRQCAVAFSLCNMINGADTAVWIVFLLRTINRTADSGAASCLDRNLCVRGHHTNGTVQRGVDH